MFSADQVAGGSRWPLVRVASHGETKVVLCSDAFLPLTVHWVGRSVVCGGETCPLCQCLPGRGLFYLAVYCNDRPSILELGALSSSLLEQHCKLLHQGIRPGLVVRLARRSAKAPVTSEVIEEKPGVARVPLMELVSRVVALYHLPGPNPNEGFDEYDARLNRIALARANSERSRLDAMNSRRV
jgi:hypothetical protein